MSPVETPMITSLKIGCGRLVVSFWQRVRPFQVVPAGLTQASTLATAVFRA